MIRIFGTKKCNDTKKTERFFKERNIKFQFIDMKEKGMGKGELTSVASAVGGVDKLINEKAKDKDMLAIITATKPTTADEQEKSIAGPSVKNVVESDFTTYYEMSDGTWMHDGHYYKYRPEMGR